MLKSLAQIPIYPNGGLSGEGPLGLPEGVDTAPATFNKVISLSIGVMTIVAAIWFIFLFLTGAIAIMSSGGDKVKVETARNKIVNGIIGLAITVAAVFIIELIGRILGIDLILNPARFVETIWG